MTRWGDLRTRRGRLVRDTALELEHAVTMYARSALSAAADELQERTRKTGLIIAIRRGMRLGLLGLIALAVACTDAEPDPAPAPPPEMPLVVVFAGPGVAELDQVERGVRAWEALGFTVTMAEPDQLPQGELCSSRWYEREERACELWISVLPDVEAPGAPWWAQSLRATREIWVRTDVRGFERAFAVAHEAGHLLLDTSEHTPTGGLLAQDPVSGLTLSDADRELAGAEIGWPWR